MMVVLNIGKIRDVKNKQMVILNYILNVFIQLHAQPTLGKAKFQSRGIKSPFISAELKMDIPATIKDKL